MLNQHKSRRIGRIFTTSLISLAAVCLLSGFSTPVLDSISSPRILVKVVDVNGDEVPGALVNVLDDDGNEIFGKDLVANNGGVVRFELKEYGGGFVTFTARDPEGNMEGDATVELWKKKGRNVVRIVIEEPAGIQYLNQTWGASGWPFSLIDETGNLAKSDIIMFYKEGDPVADALTTWYSSWLTNIEVPELEAGLYDVAVLYADGSFKYGYFSFTVFPSSQPPPPIFTPF